MKSPDRLENHHFQIGDTSATWLVFHCHVSFRECTQPCLLVTLSWEPDKELDTLDHDLYKSLGFRMGKDNSKT